MDWKHLSLAFALLCASCVSGVHAGFLSDLKDSIVNGVKDIKDSINNSVNNLVQKVETSEKEILSGYAPVRYECPFSNDAKVLLSYNQSAVVEQSFVKQRENVTMEAWKSYLNNLGFDKLDVNSIIASGKLPRVAIAASGGGLRAMLLGLGNVQAMDARYSSAVNTKTGGLFQISTYLAGLSGGSWMVGLLLDQDGVPVSNLSLDLSDSLIDPGFKNSLEYISQVLDKDSAGFPTSLVDLWGRFVSHQLYPENDASINVTFSSMADQSAVATYQFPFPLVLASLIPNPETNFNQSLPFEYNLFTTGVHSTEIDAYVPTTMLGTSMDAGYVQDHNECVTGFENFGWVLGTSSSAFADANNFLSGVDSDALRKLGKGTLGKLPNPYKGAYDELWDGDVAFIGDGGLGPWGNMPLPLVVMPQRNVDVIFALDNSADDEENYPNGQALFRAANFADQQDVPFPEVPRTTEEFSSQNLLRKVTFFGCNDDTVPTIVYIPNYNITYDTGFSTYQFKYDDEEIQGAYNNTFSVLTAGDTPVCIGCLLLASTGYSSDQCTKCLNTFCWEPPTVSVSG